MEKIEVLFGSDKRQKSQPPESHTKLREMFDRLSPTDRFEAVRGWLHAEGAFDQAVECGYPQQRRRVRLLNALCRRALQARVLLKEADECADAVKHLNGLVLRIGTGGEVVCQPSPKTAPARDSLLVCFGESFLQIRGKKTSAFRGDFLDQHTLNKALTFVWARRDELLPETIGDEFTVKQWISAWRLVLARHLRATDASVWLEEFRCVFPGAADTKVADPQVQLTGPPVEWGWLDTHGKRTHTSLSQLEREMLVEGEKIMAEVTQILDISRDGSISRSELASFFSSTRGSGDEEQYLAHLPDDEEVVLPYRGQAEKERMVLAEENRRLKARLQAMKERLVEDQNRACALWLGDGQFHRLTDWFIRKGKFSARVAKANKKRNEQKLAESMRADRKMAAEMGMAVAEELAVLNLRRKDPEELEDAPVETDRLTVRSFLARGELHKVQFGLGSEQMEQVRRIGGVSVDEELVECPAYVVSNDNVIRLQNKAQECGVNQHSSAFQHIFETMIKEDEFKSAYQAATQVDLWRDRPAGAKHVWDRLAGKFGGMIPKETLFQYCRTAPVEGLDAGVGGGVYVSFCRSMQKQVSTVLHLYLLLIFLVIFTTNVLQNKGLGPGFYQGLALDEFLMQELAGSTDRSKESTWWAWRFDDVSEPTEYWEFVENVLKFAYDGKGRLGVFRSVRMTNNVIGGVRLHQWRVPPDVCHGLGELFENNIANACYGEGDPSRVTDDNWDKILKNASHRYNTTDKNKGPEYAECSEEGCKYHYISRLNHAYMAPYGRRYPVCLIPSHPATFNRTLKMVVFPFDSARIMSEMFKWIAEEELGIRVEILERNPTDGLKLLGSGDADIVLEVWSDFRREELNAATAGRAVEAGTFGYPGRAGLYLNPSAQKLCPACLHWRNLRREHAISLSCNCSSVAECNGRTSQALDQGRCANHYACTHECSTCELGDGPDWCGPCGNGSACNPRMGCSPTLSAVWDMHPANGIITYGPEIFRSAELLLNESVQLVYAKTAEDLEQRVMAAQASQDDEDVFAGPMAWFWSEPSPLIPVTGAKRVKLPSYSKERCPHPNPRYNDPLMQTEFHCDIPDQKLKKVAVDTLETQYPDAYKLLVELQVSSADLNAMMVSRMVDGFGYDEVACNWLRTDANREKWLPWVRRGTVQLAKERQEAYYEKCFGPWGGNVWNFGQGNDEESFTEHAQFLSPLYKIEENKAGLSADYRRKVIKGYGIEEELPLRVSEFEALGTLAETTGNISAYQRWTLFKPWIYQPCIPPWITATVYGNIPEGPASVFLAPSYGCDGYSAFFPIAWTRNAAAEQVQQLKDNNWIDVATRGIMMEVFTHSQNTQLIVRTRYTVEISPTGGWWKSTQTTIFRLRQPPFLGDIIQAVLVMPLVAYFTFHTLWHIVRSWRDLTARRRYDASGGHNLWWPPLYGVRKVLAMIGMLLSPGTVIELANHLCMFITWVLRLMLLKEGPTKVNVLCTTVYPQELDWVADTSLLLDQLDGVNAILVFLRLLFFLRINPSMDDIIETVIRAGVNILWLLATFLIVMCGFTVCAWVVYGNVIAGFNGFGRSFTALLFIMLGEFDYRELSAQRPGFAFFFFFFFFVLVICILFNMIIAVIGSAYDEVASERVDVPGFVARVMHDPDTSAWAPLEMGSSRESVIVREVRSMYYRLRMLCAKDPARRQKLATRLMQNPRVFWREYEKVMQDLASDDITRVLRGHAKVRLLMRSVSVRQHVPECPYEPGDILYVKDGPPDTWRKGVMEEALGADPLVRPAGWTKAFVWKEVAVDRVQFRDSREIDENILAAVQEGDVQEAAKLREQKLHWTRVRLLCPARVFTAGGVPVLLDPETCPEGVMLKAYDIPTGTQPWRQDTVGEVLFDLPEDHEAREAGIESVRFQAKRLMIEPVGRKVSRLQEDSAQDHVELLRVNDFLDGEFGKPQRPEIDFFLTQLPAKVLNVNRTGLWIHLLRHYNRWKRRATTYTKFGKNTDDLVAELRQKTVEGTEATNFALAALAKELDSVKEAVNELRQMDGAGISFSQRTVSPLRFAGHPGKGSPRKPSQSVIASLGATQPAADATAPPTTPADQAAPRPDTPVTPNPLRSADSCTPLVRPAVSVLSSGRGRPPQSRRSSSLREAAQPRAADANEQALQQPPRSRNTARRSNWAAAADDGSVEDGSGRLRSEAGVSRVPREPAPQGAGRGDGRCPLRSPAADDASLPLLSAQMASPRSTQASYRPKLFEM